MEINATLLIQLLNFIIFFAVVKLFLLKPLMNVISQRQEKIIKFITDAEMVRDEAETMKKQYKEKLNSIQIEGSNILKEYKEEGERLKTELIQSGKKEAKRIMDHTNLEIQHKREQASRQMKNQVAELAVSLSKKVLADYVDMDKQQDIARKMAEKVKTIYDS